MNEFHINSIPILSLYSDVKLKPIETYPEIVASFMSTIEENRVVKLNLVMGPTETKGNKT